MEKVKLINFKNIQQLNRQEIIELHKEYLNPSIVNLLSLIGFTKHYVKAEGCKVWDDEGNVYLDFLGGFGALNLGHNHPKVLEAIEKVRHLPNLLQASLGAFAGVLAHNLAQIAPGKLQRSFFCNSGTEAVEGALKLARIATGKTKILAAENSFHGKTFGALSATGRDKYQNPFKPLVPDFYHFPFGDTIVVEKYLKKKDVAAVILEPIQGEGGIVVPPAGYLKSIRELCNKFDALLILDEVQTGFGRTGKMFACEHEQVEPDIMCLAKSLGGGIVPIGAYIATDTVWKKGYKGVEKATLHSSTFGGNTLACAVAIAAIEVILAENMIKNAQEMGRYLLTKLKEQMKNYPLVKDVRGKGLLIGMEFNQFEGFLNAISGGFVGKMANEYTGSMVAGELLNKHNIITAYTLNNPNVIRFEPPLTIGKEEIDQLLNALRNILSDSKGFVDLVLSAGKSFAKSKFAIKGDE